MTERVLVIGAGELGMCVIEALAKHPKKGHFAVLLKQSTLDSGNPEKQKNATEAKSPRGKF